MNFIEVEGRTYEEAVKKASLELNAGEKDLDIEVKEVDTKGILGLLGSKKIRVIARLREEEQSPENYGKQLLKDIGKFVDLSFSINVSQVNDKVDRILFLIQCDDGDVLIGKGGETLEALQHILRLTIAKRYKQNLKILVDINGFREKRRRVLMTMAKRLADKVKRTGRRLKTDPLNPYERRVIHTLFKYNKNVTTKSEGEGHAKKVVLFPTGYMHHGKH